MGTGCAGSRFFRRLFDVELSERGCHTVFSDDLLLNITMNQRGPMIYTGRWLRATAPCNTT